MKGRMGGRRRGHLQDLDGRRESFPMAGKNMSQREGHMREWASTSIVRMVCGDGGNSPWQGGWGENGGNVSFFRVSKSARKAGDRGRGMRNEEGKRKGGNIDRTLKGGRREGFQGARSILTLHIPETYI